MNEELKSMYTMVASLQQQIDQLKARNSNIKLKPMGADKVILCTPDTGGISFKKGDVCKVIAGNVVKKFTGTESSTDVYLPGIIKIGNGADTTSKVYVLVDGMDDIKVHSTSGAVVSGDKLKPSGTDLTNVVKSTDGSEANCHWIALENSDADSYVRAKFFTKGGGGGGGGVPVIPAKVLSKSGIYYICDLYGSGIDNPVTAEDQKVFVLQLNLAETLPVGTWIIVSMSQIGETGGGNVP
jgi:hypothetical protein